MQAGDLVSGKYRLHRQLGAGGMGSVWAARNELTDRDFAIKFLLPDLAHNPEALQRFFLEARACGQIKHPAVVDVYDMGQADDGSPYIVMELLEGEGFDQRLARQGFFRSGDAAIWIAFVARGLEEAHKRGLVHRDLKPGNIFFVVDARGETVPKLLDFGVSKAVGVKSGEDFVKTTTGAVLGSPAYMSPEQAKGEADIDGRSDVWSLGVILYEAVTGEIPFDAANYNALMVSIITKDHVKVTEHAPHVPVALSDVIDKALAKEAKDRIGSALQLAEMLEAVAANLPHEASPIVSSISPSRGSASTSGAHERRPFSTTEGTWSDGKKTLAMQRRRSSTLILTAALLGATLFTAVTIAALRLRGPMVAVAGRSVIALNSSLARVRQEIDQIKAEAEAQAKAKAEAEKQAKATPTPSSQATVIPIDVDEPSRPRGRGGRGSKANANPSSKDTNAKPTPGNDVHGGVDSAGF